MNEGRGQAPAAWGTSGQGQTWAGCQLETGQNQIKQAYPERAQGSCESQAGTLLAPGPVLPPRGLALALMELGFHWHCVKSRQTEF